MRKSVFGIVASGVLILSQFPIGAQAVTDERKPVSGEIDLHVIVVSPGWIKFKDDFYSDYSLSATGSGWAGLRLGVPIRLGPFVELKPTLSGLFNVMIVSGGSLDETYVNVNVIPALSAKFLFPTGKVRPYLGAEANFNIPHTTSDNFDLSTGGPGGGVFAGVSLWDHAELELGYEYVPVKVKVDRGGGKTYDFGGLMIRLGYMF